MYTENINHPIETKYCTQCGTKAIDNDYFCSKCGTKLRATPSESTPQLQNDQSPTSVLQPTNSQNNMQDSTISTELSVGLNLVSLLVPVLGLILSIIFREKRPLQAMCCKSNMILGFIICGICMMFTLILLTSGF